MNGQSLEAFFKSTLINLALVLWIVSIIIVVYLSLQSSTNLPTEFWNADKLYHAGVYCWLALLPFQCFYYNKIRYISSISMICLGLVLEIIQAYLPNRTFSIMDFVANSLGVFLGIWIGVKIQHLLKKKITNWIP
ncbi:MAG TPA: VanZ family protein [Desulfohalobiaceae bacterium]|nr:VanZ family protein [Desulfohalobiaceae bacterium]